MLRVKSLVSCTEGDLQLRRASAPLGSSQVPSGSGALSRQNWDAAPLQQHAHTSTYGQELSSLRMDLAVPADSWEGGWDSSSATVQPKDNSGTGRMKIATSSLKETLYKLCANFAGLSRW